jgi:hypothetical protein
MDYRHKPPARGPFWTPIGGPVCLPIDKNNLKGIDDLADTLINAAANGDITAMKEVGDRLEGKPAQALEHSGQVTLTHEEILAHLGEDDTP